MKMSQLRLVIPLLILAAGAGIVPFLVVHPGAAQVDDAVEPVSDDVLWEFGYKMDRLDSPPMTPQQTAEQTAADYVKRIWGESSLSSYKVAAELLSNVVEIPFQPSGPSGCYRGQLTYLLAL